LIAAQSPADCQPVLLHHRITGHLENGCLIGRRARAGVFIACAAFAVNGTAGQPSPSKSLRFSCDSASFSATLTAADLARRYGAANVVSDSINLGEGEFERGTVLFPADSTRRVEITWKDTLAQRRPAMVRVWTTRTRWETPAHITIGTRLRTLEHLNGGPFRLAGFAFDGSGWVITWSGGKLGRTSPDGCSFHAGLEPDPRDSADSRSCHKVAVRPIGRALAHPWKSCQNPEPSGAWARGSWIE